MTAELLLLALAALGHFCLLVRILNWSHGLGITSRWIEPVSAAALVTLGLAGLVGFAWMAATPAAEWPVPARLYVAACSAVAGVGLPAATVARLLRRTPPGIRGRSRDVELTAPGGRDSWIGEGRRAWILRLPGNVSLRPRCSEWSLSLSGLPATLDGLSLLHITDLHFAPTYRRAFFEAVADAAAREEADLVLLTGDILDHEVVLDWIGPVLGRLKGRLGSYAILGNHDIHHRPDRVAGALEEAGYTVLDGRWEALAIDGARVEIGGTWEPWGAPLPPVGPEDEAFRIVLSHSPDTFGRGAEWRADLIIAGHNHGGQVRLPVVGPVLVPSRFGRRYDQGFFRRGRTLLHVSPGIGAKHPIRFRCPPEFSRLVLLRPAARTTPRTRRAAFDRST